MLPDLENSRVSRRSGVGGKDRKPHIQCYELEF